MAVTWSVSPKKHRKRLRARRNRMANELVEMAGELLTRHEAPLRLVNDLWRQADQIALGFTLDEMLVTIYSRAFERAARADALVLKGWQP